MSQSKQKQATTKRRSNLRAGLLVLMVPIGLGVLLVGLVVTGLYQSQLVSLGSQRLVTDGWWNADATLKGTMVEPGRQYAYYQVKAGQTAEEVADHFGVSLERLEEMNPGTIIGGTTIKVPPVERALQEALPNGNLPAAKVQNAHGIVRVYGDFTKPEIVTDLPQLKSFLDGVEPGVVEQVGPKHWRINRPLSIEKNIRLDITDRTADVLELRSAPGDIVCLCFEDGASLIRNVTIRSYDPTTDDVDRNAADERSYIRARKTSRMDIINSDISFLGNDIIKNGKPIQSGGGTYGVSWRIPDNRLGIDIATGWVEGNDFHHNLFGSFTFGASGMVWRLNKFVDNDVYGLDPHDDSNNALVENNIFARNGKHGFIVSKRCNFNVIRKNVSFDNGFHGYMLHQDSVYNLIENNIGFNNTDNVAIFSSDYNVVRNNQLSDARLSNVRINEQSTHNFVVDNEMSGGNRGVYVYGGSSNTYIKDNTITKMGTILVTDGAESTLFTNNAIDDLEIRQAASDIVIFGPNETQQATGIRSLFSRIVY